MIRATDFYNHIFPVTHRITGVNGSLQKAAVIKEV